MSRSERIVFHWNAIGPYLLATSFPLAMWLHNLAEEPTWLELAATFGSAWIVTAVGDLGLRLMHGWVESRCSDNMAVTASRKAINQNWRTVGLATWILFCLAYGHLFHLLANGHWLHRQVLPAWVAAWLIVWLVSHWARRTRFVDAAANALRWFCPALLIVQVVGAIPAIDWHRLGIHDSMAASLSRVSPGDENLAIEGGGPSPDIYYIILDAYAREDVLREIHHFDNSPFLTALRGRGFTIPDEARSNYAQTRLSLASSLSMDYLPIAESDDPYDLHHTVIRGLRQNSLVSRRLKRAGYVYRYVGNPYFPQDSAADEQYLLDDQGDAYVLAFLATTVFGRPAYHVLNSAECFSGPVEVHDFQLAHIPWRKSRLGPMFTFAHLCCPHAPYVYDRHGRLPERVPDERSTSRDYIEQLRYLNGRVLELIDAIDRTSGQDAVIVLQADHGSDDFGVPPSARPETRMPRAPNERQLFERMSIFCAVRGPASIERRLYPGVTPVNLFRIVFNGLFGDDWLLLPDRSLYSVYDTPFRMLEWEQQRDEQVAGSTARTASAAER